MERNNAPNRLVDENDPLTINEIVYYRRTQLIQLCFASLFCFTLLSEVSSTPFFKTNIFTGITLGMVAITAFVLLMTLKALNSNNKKTLGTNNSIENLGLFLGCAGNITFFLSFIYHSTALNYTTTSLLTSSIFLLGLNFIYEKSHRTQSRQNNNQKLSTLNTVFFLFQLLAVLILCHRGFMHLLEQYPINSNTFMIISAVILGLGIVGALGTAYKRRSYLKATKHFKNGDLSSSHCSKIFLMLGGVIGFFIGMMIGYTIGVSGLELPLNTTALNVSCAIFFSFAVAMLAANKYERSPCAFPSNHIHEFQF